MTQLGEALVFYLKYTAEMDHLYRRGDEADLTGVPDEQKVRDMAASVGTAASEQAADFLELCGQRIKGHFAGLGADTGPFPRGRVVSEWRWWAMIHTAAVAKKMLYCGVSIIPSPRGDRRGVIVPWFQAKRGGHAGAVALLRILRGWPLAYGGGHGLIEWSDTLALACIPIEPRPPESYVVDRDQLIAKVMELITRIRAEEFNEITKYVAGARAPDEP
jgi:hypothetical protein